VIKGTTEKIYAYVDETGQDTMGDLFIVSVVVTKKDRDDLLNILKDIEKATGKNKLKWIKTKPEIQIAYLEKVLGSQLFKNKIHFSITVDTKAYRDSTIVAIATAVNKVKDQDKYKAVVFIDGLKDREVNIVGSGLRKIGLRVEKVRGVRDESSVFIRLADAICGVVRKSQENVGYAETLYKIGIRKGTLKRLK